MPGTERHAATRLHGLDTLRAVAILAVMPFHLARYLPEALQPVAQFGWMGVDLFFVLSGYLIGLQCSGRTCRAGRSMWGSFIEGERTGSCRRSLRCCCSMWLCRCGGSRPGCSRRGSLPRSRRNLLIDYSRNHAFSHAWSLCVEEHFYLVLPVLTVTLMRRPRAWKGYGALALFALGGVVLRAYLLVHVLRPLGPDSEVFPVRYFEDLYYPTPVRLDGLLAGVSLALVQTFRPGWAAGMARRGTAWRRRGWCWSGWRRGARCRGWKR